MNSQIATHMKLTHVPAFWDPAKAYQLYRPDTASAKMEAMIFARDHKLEAAHQLVEKGANAVFLTDLQEDFRESGRLAVTGTNDVVLRACARLIEGFHVGYYGGVMTSHDGHPAQHISFASYFRTQDGSLLDLRQYKAAILTLVDDKKALFQAQRFGPGGELIDMGIVQPVFNMKDAVAYYKHLEATGQLPMWVFDDHCILGTDGVGLHPLLVETLAYVSALRRFVPGMVNKGHLITTDWFGPLEPCRPDPTHPQGGFQTWVTDWMAGTGVQGSKPFETVEFFGVAEDFCDYNMKKQTLRILGGTEYAKALRFVKDGVAAIIPNAAHVQKQNAEAAQAGVVFINSTDPFTL